MKLPKGGGGGGGGGGPPWTICSFKKGLGEKERVFFRGIDTQRTPYKAVYKISHTSVSLKFLIFQNIKSVCAGHSQICTKV